MRTSIRLYWLLFPLTASAGLPEALRYLEQEVPRWRSENGCYSCHNNGDGARALLSARALGIRVDDKAVRDSIEWLQAPGTWEPKALARVQFSAALVAALDTDLLDDKQPLLEAARLLAGDQSSDGSWNVEAEGTLGSATTYGPYLATYLARASLVAAGADRFAGPIDKATRWLQAQTPRNPLDAAAHFLATRNPASLEMLLRSQAASGAWLNEPFDTAVAILAMAAVRDRPEVTDRIARARAWLLRTQLSKGGWPGTTRPAGGNSYAQHLSTSAWAAIALAVTEPASPAPPARSAQ
jgi:hypothetical protein